MIVKSRKLKVFEPKSLKFLTKLSSKIGLFCSSTEIKEDMFIIHMQGVENEVWLNLSKKNKYIVKVIEPKSLSS